MAGVTRDVKRNSMGKKGKGRAERRAEVKRSNGERASERSM